MKHYEIVFLVHPDQSDQTQSVLNKFSSIVTESGGKVHRLENIGRRKLAYPIQDQFKASYALLNIECKKEAISEIQSSFKFNDSIIRSLVLTRSKAEADLSALSRQTEEVNKIIRVYPKEAKISMGYGSSLEGYLNLYTRPILIYHNDYFFIELPHLFLTSVSKPIQGKTLEKISNCINDVYLIPKDESPFNLENNKEYFSKDFINTFHSSFKKKKCYHFFDTGECKR